MTWFLLGEILSRTRQISGTRPCCTEVLLTTKLTNLSFSTENTQTESAIKLGTSYLLEANKARCLFSFPDCQFKPNAKKDTENDGEICCLCCDMHPNEGKNCQKRPKRQGGVFQTKFKNNFLFTVFVLLFRVARLFLVCVSLTLVSMQ